MATKLSFETLMSDIAELASAEKITKAKLGSISRDALIFTMATQDVRPVNALLGQDEAGSFLLTPINHRIAIQYFDYFLPFKSNMKDVKAYAVKGEGERQALVFTKKDKRKWDEKHAEIEQWLNDPANNVWTWSNNVEMKANPVDYGKKVEQAVKAAVNPEKGGMDADTLLAHVVGAEGMSLGMLLDAVARLGEQEQAA